MNTNNTTLPTKIINRTSELITIFRSRYRDTVLDGFIEMEERARSITGWNNKVDNVLVHIGFNFISSTLLYELALSYFGLSGYGLLLIGTITISHLLILRDNTKIVESN